MSRGDDDITIAQAAELLQRSERYVRTLIARGVLQAHVVAGQHVIAREEVERYLRRVAEIDEIAAEGRADRRGRGAVQLGPGDLLYLLFDGCACCLTPALALAVGIGAIVTIRLLRLHS